MLLEKPWSETSFGCFSGAEALHHLAHPSPLFLNSKGFMQFRIWPKARSYLSDKAVNILRGNLSDEVILGPLVFQLNVGMNISSFLEKILIFTEVALNLRISLLPINKYELFLHFHRLFVVSCCELFIVIGLPGLTKMIPKIVDIFQYYYKKVLNYTIC